MGDEISDYNKLRLVPSVNYHERRKDCVFADIDLSVFHTEQLKKILVARITGTIDLSPLTNLSFIAVTYRSQPDGEYLFPLYAEGYAPFVIFPESESLEEVTIQGSVGHDRKTLARLPNLKRLMFHHLEDADLSWLNGSSSLTYAMLHLGFQSQSFCHQYRRLKRLH